MANSGISSEKTLGSIAEALASLDVEAVRSLCVGAMEEGFSAHEILVKGMGRGMDIVGQKYESGEYFLTELVAAGEIMKQVMDLLKPHLKKTTMETRETIVIGTIQGDLHDIGKNIFGNLAIGAGFNVIDLGIDVAPSSFADAVRANDARIVGISALLTTTMLNMRNAIEALRKAGLRDRVRVIVGGAPISEDFGKEIGADAAANDAVNGIEKVKGWAPGNVEIGRWAVEG